MEVSKRYGLLSVHDNRKIWSESLRGPSTTELNDKAVTDKTLVEHNNVVLNGVEYCRRAPLLFPR
jgi:hypothetical protein